mgnify:CR=1 FL=1
MLKKIINNLNFDIVLACFWLSWFYLAFGSYISIVVLGIGILLMLIVSTYQVNKRKIIMYTIE